MEKVSRERDGWLRFVKQEVSFKKKKFVLYESQTLERMSFGSILQLQKAFYRGQL